MYITHHFKLLSHYITLHYITQILDLQVKSNSAKIKLVRIKICENGMALSVRINGWWSELSGGESIGNGETEGELYVTRIAF
jgi:hypothetical protein